MAAFDLDPRLAANHHVTDWPLCSIFLENDARFPWLVMVPRVPGLREVYDLPIDVRAQFFTEVTAAAERLAGALNPVKTNVAMLGNMVPQLHAHVIARFETDPAWPGPVWGVGERRPYEGGEAAARLSEMKEILGAAP